MPSGAKRIEQVSLPGVGVRYDCVTAQGKRIGVIAHHSGHRELVIYDADDPDATRDVLHLEEDDTRALVEMLGASQVTEQVTRIQSVEGLTIDWLPVEADSAVAGRTIGDTQLRRRTGVTIVAVVREGRTIPSPPPTFGLQSGDTAVLVGRPEDIRQALTLLRPRR